MNELTCPAFTLACGGDSVRAEDYFRGGGGDVQNVSQIRDRWHVNAEGEN